jgi:hypothetical protein
MSERAPFNSPEVEQGWVTSNDVAQHLGGLAIELFTGPRKELVEMVYPIEAIKDWKRGGGSNPVI